MKQQNTQSIFSNFSTGFLSLGFILTVSGCTLQDNQTITDVIDTPVSTAPLTPSKMCSTALPGLNTAFSTVSPMSGGQIPNNSGVLVHTIHGPGTTGTELNMKKLNALPVDKSKSCGDFLAQNIYLPWCGSNRNPLTKKFNDTSSWSYIRHDTLSHGTVKRTDEVVCANNDNKKYGLIFSNNYLNQSIGNTRNLGCMYPLDGDTGNRESKGCGVSVNTDPCIVKTLSKGTCGDAMTATTYRKEFQTLLDYNNGDSASCAGSMICSLDASQFDLWVDVRKTINLTHTTWPVDEFVLYNWEHYSTQDLADDNLLIGIYYLTGCGINPDNPSEKVTDGNAKEAQEIANLYKKWSGVDLPVVNLSNMAMKNKSTTPFSCPT